MTIDPAAPLWLLMGDIALGFACCIIAYEKMKHPELMEDGE